MATRQERQRFLRHYRDSTGDKELDMHKVAAFAKAQGWKMPTPPSDVDLLAKQFADDAQAEKKIDGTTGQPYRVYHAVPVSGAQMHLFVYVDIEDASRHQMLKSAVHRREQMVSDGLNVTNDLDHWNRAHPDQEPIQLTMDLAFDIEIRRAAAEVEDQKAA